MRNIRHIPDIIRALKGFSMKTALLSACMVAGGCASHPDDIGAQAVSPALYRDYACDELQEEKSFVDGRLTELYTSLQSESRKDTAQVAAGVAGIVVWPLLFSFAALEGGDGAEAVEYSRLRGRSEAIRQALIRKKCQLGPEAEKQPEKVEE